VQLNSGQQELYNSRIIDTFTKYIKRTYPYIKINEVLEYAKMEPYQVADEGHWFTQEQVDRFYEFLVRITGNRNIAREAGRYSASPESLGMMREYVIGFIGPQRAYEMISKYAPDFTKSSDYDAKKTGDNSVEITVTPKPGVEEKKYQCENRMGHLEAVAGLFRYRLPEIEHPECIFRAGSACRYKVTWRNLRSTLWKNIRNVVALFFLGVLTVLFFFSPELTVKFFTPIAVLVILALSLVIARIENRELITATDSLRATTEKLLHRVSESHRNEIMIKELGMSISNNTEVNGILDNVCLILQKSLDYDRGMILLANEDRTRLEFRAGFGYTDRQFATLKDLSFHLDRPDSKGIFVRSFYEQKPYLINDINEIVDDMSERSLIVAKRMGTKSFICCPIIYENRSLGILAVDNLETKRPLLQKDLNLIMGVTPAIGISINNARLFEIKEKQFSSLLQVLGASIDARDTLTAGHSERVTEYALGICRELSSSSDCIELVKVSAQLHDYGKLGVPDNILQKRGRLTSGEREQIKSHAEKTKNILQKVNFTGVYRSVPEVVWAHHEKWDGSGYPRGLKGQEIPLGARIIAVADVYEALTSQRHYRDPMAISEALKLMQEESNKSFDPLVVQAFFKYYLKAYSNALELLDEESRSILNTPG
jgi:HD-GYP domain-containing protein (c-di-GMP phosphodiesterase class II)